MALRKMVMLAVVFIVLLGVSYLVTRPPGTEQTSGLRPGDKVFPGLDLNAVETVHIVGPESTGTISRREGKWVAADLHGYPADFSALRERLRSLGDLKVGQLAGTPDEELLEEFGLDTGATRVSLLAKDGSELAGLDLGDMRQSGTDGAYGGRYPDGQYVRAGAGPVLLVAGSLGQFSADSADWIDKGLLKVTGNDILSISVASTNGAYTIDFTGDPAMAGLAEDEEIDTAAAGQLRRALQYLSCLTVAGPAGADHDVGFDAPATFTALTTNGISYTVLIGGTTKNGRYVRFELDSTETEDTGQELDELAFLEDWTYVVSTFNADSMTLDRDRIVKKVEPANGSVR